MSKNSVVLKRNKGNLSLFHKLGSVSCLFPYRIEDDLEPWGLHMFISQLNIFLSCRTNFLLGTTIQDGGTRERSSVYGIW